jgi:hypothetical protein
MCEVVMLTTSQKQSKMAILGHFWTLFKSFVHDPKNEVSLKTAFFHQKQFF